MKGYLLRKRDIDAMPGLDKRHFLNDEARRNNRSLGDETGLSTIGVHLIEVAPGAWSTEFHRHYFEDECVYVLSGTATVEIGDETVEVGSGDFLGFRAGGEAHTMRNSGDEPLRCLVAGTRLAHDVADYPRKGKRLFRNADRAWDLADIDRLDHPVAGRKR